MDALLGQMDGEEVWLTVCSSSPWATRQPTDFLPPSPAHDINAYGEFIRRLVRRCDGRVRFWQCDNEPSNTELLWAGTAPEYVTQLTAFHAAVKDIDPGAAVVLGGCGYDVFSSEPGSPQRQFFDHLASAGRDAFDLFSVNLYGDPARVPEFVECARDFMRTYGYLKPIVAGEHGGPVLFEFPEVEPILHGVLAEAFTGPETASGAAGPETAPDAAGSEAASGAAGAAEGTSGRTQGTDELIAQAGPDTPERRAMASLYAHMDDLPPRLQMFMAGCSADLEAKRHRISCRQLVMRTVLALSVGVRRTAYWCLGPEVPNADDPYQIMHLMFGKLPMLDYDGRTLDRRHPSADTFALLAAYLRGAVAVTPVDVGGHGDLFAFRVDRDDRDPVLVLWRNDDTFDGEDEPPITVEWPWSSRVAIAADAFGNTRTIDARDGTVQLDVSVTPRFVEAGR